MFFGKKPKSFLGIDIGTSSIKVVQLKKEEDRFKLETYGEISTINYLKRLTDAFQVTTLKTLEAITREMLKIILQKAEVTAEEAVLTIPVFSSFVSAIEMPAMAEKEMARAVEFEARRYVPISLAEVVLDWQIVETGMIKDEVSPKPFKGTRIILIAVPREVVNKYIKIAEGLDLRIGALELETFSLTRSLMVYDKSPTCILDIGARATSFTIVDKAVVQMSHSLDVAGAEMTQALATGLKVASTRAEEFKIAYGLNHRENKERRAEFQGFLSIPVDKIISEIERMIGSYQSKTARRIEKLILNGGSAQMAGLKDYIEQKMNLKAFIATPWARIIYPPVLQETLRKIGPQFSVAIGAAMRGK